MIQGLMITLAGFDQMTSCMPIVGCSAELSGYLSSLQFKLGFVGGLIMTIVGIAVFVSGFSVVGKYDHQTLMPGHAPYSCNKCDCSLYPEGENYHDKKIIPRVYCPDCNALFPYGWKRHFAYFLGWTITVYNWMFFIAAAVIVTSL